MSNFTISRHFAAPRKLVYDCWVNPDHLNRWCKPKGCDSVLVLGDIRPGGAFRQRMKLDEHSEFFPQFSFLKLSPLDSLEFVVSFVAEDGTSRRHPFIEHWPARLHTLVTFADEGDGTRVTVLWTPVEATDAEEATFDENKPSCDAGWSGSFDLLEELLTELEPSKR